jgi:alpha-galactosidase
MIVHENGTFLLKNGNLSCLLSLNQWGQPELLHFGAPIELEDARVLTLQPSCGWGTKVLLEDGNAASCPDAMGLFWSGSGRGDYRESPAEFSFGAVNLRYVNHEIVEGGVPMNCTLPQAKKATESLVMTFAGDGVEVKHIFSLFDTAMTRRTVVKNTGETYFFYRRTLSHVV